MRKEIEKGISECRACLRYNRMKEGYHPAKSITAVDVCSGYTVLRALKTKEMEGVAKALWSVFSEYGTPKIIQSDNGPKFVNHVIKAMTIIYSMEHQLSTAYHPSTNGLVKRRNKEVGKLLKKFTERHNTDGNE